MTSVEHSSDSQEFSEQDDERPPKKKLKSAGDREINIPPAMNSVKPTPAPKVGKNINFQKGIEDTQACNHEIDLDVRDPILERKDVDGGDLDLEELNSYKRPELERLMRMYGLPVSSALKKPEIIDRITAHVARGKGEKVIPGFGAGYWHKRKRTKLIEENHIQTNLPMVPLPGKAWSPFPSTHIPEGFHYLDILDYFEAIPEIDFSYKRGVVKHEAPEVLSLHHDSSGDEDEDDVEEDCHEMTFKNLCRRAIKKCLQKGEQFLAGGRLLCMMDTKRDKHYFLKAQVQASMEDKVYGVDIIFNETDGSICSADCLCKARELKRCGHIAAVLLRLWQHIYAKGCEAVTTTGTQCYWRKSGNPKNPGLVREKQYESKKPLEPRINFDPRPTAYRTDGICEAELKMFKENLQQSTPTCLFLYHLDSGFIPSTVMDSEIVLDLQTDEGCQMLADECSKMLWKLARKCQGKSGPFEVPNTRGQHNSKEWHQERALCVNPSSAKTFLQLKKEITIIRWLRKKVWLLDNFENEAMRTGKRLESTARKKCETKLKEEVHQDYNIIQTGLWKNPKYPQMACSPDGIITFPGEKNKLLEIKVLTMLNYHTPESDQGVYNLEELEDADNPEEDIDSSPEKGRKVKKLKPINPEKFEEEMSPQQRRTFYLKRNEQGCIILRHAHQYNYQIQMSLDILELQQCILCVYSETGCILVTVEYDPTFWEEKRDRLLQRHREMVIPEAILGRTKRWLPPCQLIYSIFHEDPKDDYFESDNNAKD